MLENFNFTTVSLSSKLVNTDSCKATWFFLYLIEETKLHGKHVLWKNILIVTDFRIRLTFGGVDYCCGLEWIFPYVLRFRCNNSEHLASWMLRVLRGTSPRSVWHHSSWCLFLCLHTVCQGIVLYGTGASSVTCTLVYASVSSAMQLKMDELLWNMIFSYYRPFYSKILRKNDALWNASLQGKSLFILIMYYTS